MRLHLLDIAAATVALLGLYVMAGWIVGSEAWVRVVPNAAAAGVNTAFLFLVVGICLFSIRRTRCSHAAVWTAWLLVLLPGAVLVEHAFRINLGIDWVAFHAWMNDGNPYPGRMAPNTCMGFLCAGLAVLFARRAATRTWLRWATTLCVCSTLAIGLAALVGYGLKLEMMYRVAAFNRMAVSTALGMSLVGLALWYSLRAPLRGTHKAIKDQDKQITGTAATVLILFAVISGLTGFAVLKQGVETVMVESVRHTTKHNTAAFVNALEHSLALASTVAAHPTLHQYLILLSDDQHDEDMLGLVQQVGHSFLSSGLTGINFLNAQGQVLVTSGSIVQEQAVMAVPLVRSVPEAFLLWHDGFVLQTHTEVRARGHVIGHVITEQRLVFLTHMLRDIQHAGASSDVLVCGRTHDVALCFPTKFYPPNTRIAMFKEGKPNLPINHALLGESGVKMVQDLRGIAVLAGYAPIGDLGLGMVIKADLTEVYEPMRHRLHLLLGLLAAFVLAGTLILRAQVQPIVRLLIKEQQRMHTILESLHEAFVEIDQHGVITAWNAEAERTFGWPRHDVLGQSMAEVIIPPALRDRHHHGIAKFLASGEGQIFGKRLELAALHRSGRELPVEVTISHINTEEGSTFTAFLHDISERKQAETALAQAMDHLEAQNHMLAEARDEALQATRAKSAFLASMSHEIRTPMNAILGMADLLEETPLTLLQQDYVQRFKKAGEHLLTLINDILDLSKIEAGQLALEQTPFSLEDLIATVAELMAMRAHAKGLELFCTIAPDVPLHLCGDPHRLRQILVNLLSNAIKFTESGEVVLRVDNEPERSRPGRLRFTVRDTGIGIPAEKLGSIFESFTQVDTSTTRKYGGTGLGLSISKQLAELMDGRIWVESRLGQGSTFSVTVQCALSSTPAEPLSLPLPVLVDMPVLVVDDNATNRLILRDMLLGWGARVTEVCGAADALSTWTTAEQAAAPFQLVLVDRQMPGTDGLDLAAQLSQTTSYRTATLILLSSEARPGDQERCRALGIPKILLKPVTRPSLLRAITEAFGQRSMRVPLVSSPPPPPTPAARGLAILVAEDNEDNQMLIKAYLQKTTHHLTLAENGAVAVERFQAGHYDLVLMDMQMPVMDGYTATRRLRQWEQEQHQSPTVIVALTANALPEEIQQSLEAGCNGHLSKPIKKAALLAALADYTANLITT
jgi:PAS domain S-box-containing protein